MFYYSEQPFSIAVKHTRNFRSSLLRDNHTQISHIAGDLSMNTLPWNKDRIIGQKRPFRYLISGGSESGLNWKVKRAIWTCSIWLWTVSCGAVI
ncbi:hypothetical protein Dda3937_04537 [Dickeya dadantii 3937]|uniref:Uncharacterized protein n=1 Tax=Dickeya dadantii (strain 3937) TaxID=198628 RepID=E0SK67_DICD3|nr:hypothetical protein Dda3937_04537 [Dickeya dadantii 3937]